MGVNKESIEELRDCVKQAFLEGSQRGAEFRKMRHAIIIELKRAGCDSSDIKDKLVEWDQRCERPLNLGEQRNQLFKYVDWVDSQECRLSCKALKDYCLGNENCQFHKRTT